MKHDCLQHNLLPSPVRRALRVGILLSLCVLAAGCAARQSRNNEPFTSPDARMAQSLELAKQAQAAHAGGDLNKAIALYQDAVTTNPDFGAAWHNLALSLAQRKGDSDFVAAANAYKRAIALLPSDPTPLRNLGMLYDDRGWGEDAMQYVTRALEIAPQDRDSLRLLTKIGRDLRVATPLHLDYLRRAQLSEVEPNWRGLIEKERLRVENDLREKRSSGVLMGG
jgi:tetratricopeptide (TPR) repeat protein